MAASRLARVAATHRGSSDRRPGLWLLHAIWLLMLCLAPARAAAADAPGYAFGEPGAEIALALGSAASLAALALPQRRSSWAPSAEGPGNRVAAIASDFTGAFIGTSWQLTLSYALEADYYVRQRAREPFARALRSSLIELEAVLLTAGITAAMKRLSGRCRPRSYRSGRCDGAEHKAFPSGHTSPIAAIAGAELLLAVRTKPASTGRYVAFSVAETAALTTAILRVVAGAHSWEDVVAGLAVGHATGSLVSLAHPMEDAPSERVLTDAPPQAPVGFLWAGSF